MGRSTSVSRSKPLPKKKQLTSLSHVVQKCTHKSFPTRVWLGRIDYFKEHFNEVHEDSGGLVWWLAMENKSIVVHPCRWVQQETSIIRAGWPRTAHYQGIQKWNQPLLPVPDSWTSKKILDFTAWRIKISIECFAKVMHEKSETTKKKPGDTTQPQTSRQLGYWWYAVSGDLAMPGADTPIGQAAPVFVAATAWYLLVS